METALDIYEMVGNDTVGADFEFAQDWSTAKYYSQGRDPATGLEGTWKVESYCLQGHTYEACGEKQNVKPPDPPVVKGLR